MKTDDDFTIYGICREPECHYIWLREPTDPPNCPRCGDTRWPMSPYEADAVRRSRKSRERMHTAQEGLRMLPGDVVVTMDDGTVRRFSDMEHAQQALGRAAQEARDHFEKWQILSTDRGTPWSVQAQRLGQEAHDRFEKDLNDREDDK